MKDTAHTAPINRLFVQIFSLLLSALPLSAGLSINPTFVDSAGQTWDDVSRGVVERAISDWLAVLDAPNPSDDLQIDITFDFTTGASYLGQWQGSSSGLFVGDDRLPWLNTSHIIHINADRLDQSLPNYSWWDPTPDDASDQPFEAWDLLSVTRHELGHVLGFTSDFYVYDIATPQEVRPWSSLITDSAGRSLDDPNFTGDAIFDLGGLNVTLAAPNNIGHVANSGNSLDDLLTPGLPNSVRREVSALDGQILSLAYGYTLVPEPSVLSFFSLSVLVLLRRRR